jgi:hypothetical protein
MHALFGPEVDFSGWSRDPPVTIHQALKQLMSLRFEYPTLVMRQLRTGHRKSAACA